MNASRASSAVISPSSPTSPEDAFYTSAVDALLADYADVDTEARQSYATPLDLAVALNPHTVRTPALETIALALTQVSRTPDGRLIITMPPQEGKSTLAAGDFPTHVLLEEPDTRIVVASYGQNLATRNGRAIRQRITQNPQLGLTIAPDNGAVHEWTLDGHAGGVLSVGVGGGLTGRPADLLVIDDPIKDRIEAESETFRQRVWDWWTDVASTRLAPGAPVVVILTRWHEDDLAGRLLAADDDEPWQVLNIPAQADHRPEKGETDALGRKVGEYMASARVNKRTGAQRTVEQWERIKRRSGSRTWTSLYQGRPTPDAGNVLQRAWWKRFDLLPEDLTEVITSWDMTFKDTKGSDFVVGQVWGRREQDVFLLDQVRGRWDFAATCKQVTALAARWPKARAHLVEDKANGPAVISQLRSTLAGLIPVEPEGSKYSRAAAVSPFIESGNVHLPRAGAWVDEFIEECSAFPNSAHDDQVDAMSQALHRLLIHGSVIEAWARYARRNKAE